MQDAEYIFKTTEKERKRLGRGAFSKKGGVRSKKCTLPSDYLTEAERRAMNGEVNHYNMNHRYSWEEFMKLPVDIQQLYQQTLINAHGARLQDIAAYLGTNLTNLYNWNSRHKIKLKTIGYRKMSSSWSAFINAEEHEAEEVNTQAEEVKTTDEASCAVKQEDILTVNNGEVFMTGLPAAIFEKTMAILDPSKRYCIRIGFFEDKLKERLK